MSQLKNMIRGAKPEVLILEQGTFLLGRAPECEYLIIHPSVSTTHCEIRKDHGRVFIRDLGSTNGTFIEDEPVKEAELLPDQIVRFGETVWRFQGTSLHVDAATTAPAEEPVAEPAAPSTSEVPWPLVPNLSINVDRKTKEAEAAALKELPRVQRPCSKHPYVPALYICLNCHSEFCGECVHVRQGSKVKRLYCHNCNGRCEDIGVYELKAAERTVQRERQRNLFLNLPDVFLYPLRSWNLFSTLSAVLLFGFLAAVLKVIPALGIFAAIKPIIASFCITAYLVAYMYKIVQSSANGDAEMPEWMDFSNWWDDILVPAFHFFATALLSFSPLLIYLYYTFPSPSPWIWLPLLIVGLSYFPMAYLTVCMSNSLSTANPVTVYWSILRVPLNYCLACLVFWGAYFLSFTIGVIASLLPLKYDMLGLALQFISIPVALYLYLIEARVLGLIYFSGYDKLGWFEEKE
jgi:hypothetical protein